MRKNEDELLQMSNETSPMFEGINGLVSRYTFSNIQDGITSGLFFCEDLETAQKVKTRVNEVIEKYDEFIGFTNEFIFKVIESITYE